jgi:TusE/DsrC/DsvC family sulfur relay protein
MAAVDKGPSDAAEKWGDTGAPGAPAKDPDFPHAPEGWSRVSAEEMAGDAGLKLTQDHWEVFDALQEYCQRHECSKFSTRELHDALDERFHAKGGYKYLFGLFPGGPIAQGCRLAGLEPPAGAVDKGFGSVV